jgi:hypothetical protein
MLRERYRTAAKFDAFCIDYFASVYTEFTNGMDRTTRENMLFTEVGIDPLWAVLHGHHGLDVKGALEQLTSIDPFINTSQLARWILRVERQVCMVRCGAENGTGFLVAPDLVLTCYHVVESHLKGDVPRDAVKVRFDYRVSATGVPPPPYEQDWESLDVHWTIPHAPYSAADLSLVGDPAPGELDFALLRLSSKKGGEVPPGEHGPRGWVDLSSTPHTPTLDAPVLIVQHPGVPNGTPPQMPLKISFATPGFVHANGNGTRLVYHPSTLPGSSGSPVFDAKLAPVALHHNRGEPHPTHSGLVANNRGVPLAKIRTALDDATRALLVAPPTD